MNAILSTELSVAVGPRMVGLENERRWMERECYPMFTRWHLSQCVLGVCRGQEKICGGPIGSIELKEVSK